ncbi:MAG: transketolase [Verrucomicrobiae bacterium]|nr:transketolase [Verrucomicrobiae bacterium]
MTPACREIRRRILQASFASGHGHIPTSFSIVEMLCAVYETMRHDPRNPDWPERDIFILSKGHAALGFYAVLAHYGYFPAEELASFGAFGSRLGCHPDRFKVPGVELSTGSLGHGIAVAVGMALGFRLQGSSRRVFTLVGDGECNEGSVWEAVAVATHLRLTNLTVLLDYNRSQVRSLPIPNPAERFAAFGCDTIEADGHDLDALKAALQRPARNTRAVVAHTIKGFGCPTLVNNVFEWHRKSPKPEEFEKLMAELDAA